MNPDSSTTDLPRPWGRHALSVDRPLALRIGPCDIWAQAVDGEIRVAKGEVRGVEEARSPAPLAPEPPDDAEWSRWATPAGEGDLILRPALPDRTVVLQPETPFRLLPRAEARIYVRVPLWVRIEFPLRNGQEVLLLEELPTLGMSDSWWGSFIDGELVYWLPTTARREMRPELHLAHLAACPLQLSNRSGTVLQVDKLAFRVAHLSLFAHGEYLWADEARVTYQGDAEGSRIEMSERSPAEASGAPKVGSPRIPVPRGFRARTFHRLLSLPGIGGAA